jgi:hypothetical protein
MNGFGHVLPFAGPPGSGPAKGVVDFTEVFAPAELIALGILGLCLLGILGLWWSERVRISKKTPAVPAMREAA